MLALAAVSPAAAAAQTAQPWPGLQLSVPLAGRWSALAEGVYRVSPDSRRASQFRSRGWLYWRATHRLRLGLGYGHQVTYQPTGANGIENQIAEQAIWTALDRPRLRLLSRTRLEERFLRGDDGTGVRLREQLRVEFPVAAGGPAIALWSEPFVNVARTRLASQRLDQLRSFVGLIFPAGRRMSVELGYLKQYQPRPTGAVWTDAVPMTVALRF